MSRKIIIASIVLALILVVGGGVWRVSAPVKTSQKENDDENKKLLSEYIESYELRNAVITSKENLVKGFNLLFDKEPNLEGIKCVPNLKIKFKKEVSFNGFITDKYKYIISRARTYPSYIDKGKEVIFYWDSAREFINGDYNFYIELYDKNDRTSFTLRSNLVKIKIPDNNLKGFSIYSPPLTSMLTGLHANRNMEEQPIVAWVDTFNKGVIKYQLFDATPALNPSLKPIIDNIPSNLRQINVDKQLFDIDIKAPLSVGEQGFHSFNVRAVLKNGSHIDSRDSGPVEFFEKEKKDVSEILLK